MIVGVSVTVTVFVLFMVLVALSVTVMFTLHGVAMVGIPEITPVLVLMLRPVGKPVADQVYGPVPPVAVIAVEGYATLTIPAGSDTGPVIASAGLIVSKYDLLAVRAPVSVEVT